MGQVTLSPDRAAVPYSPGLEVLAERDPTYPRVAVNDECVVINGDVASEALTSHSPASHDHKGAKPSLVMMVGL
ncbi:hypothetical protein ACFYO7_30150 [Nocardia salmonicida]|uniref:hypothetical protein n=1 Tax=Nocardia salmonicida TaxID=53431 RepID=UPI0036C255F2